MDSEVLAKETGPRGAGSGVTESGKPIPHFLVHNPKDSVGVVVVEDVTAGMTLNGWVTDTDETIHVVAKDDIPLGHKVALRDIAEGETILKYGHDIGKAVAAIPQGGHAHVHNVKTKRW
ncbi:UxaA family hydrolase [Telmatospirillum sp. J64-1]|uniref:UxaA family hydrolase n=1 Tax=Telmatospirillum sp. J64-1 TaxID=2502183 RepID=UPI00115CE543|nr:UxaA family hydrolase [Telmatospirillum sp. J64-1]